MFKKSSVRIQTALSALFTLLFLVGCNLEEIEVAVDEEYRDAVVQVDFIKIWPDDLDEWKNKSIDEYFSPDDPKRKVLTSNERFSVYWNVPNKTFTRIIKMDESLEEKFGFKKNWIGLPKNQDFDILILADLPGVSDSTQTVKRLYRVPLFGKAWPKKSDRLRISIGPQGIELDPAPDESSRR